MSERTFLKILIIIAVIGVIVTVAHMIYICHAYPNSSIIQFVAREKWL